MSDLRMTTATERILQTRCAKCGLVRDGDTWRAPIAGEAGPYSHGYCPECYERELGRIQRMARQ